MLRFSRSFVAASVLLAGAGLLFTTSQAESQGKLRPFKAVGTAVWDDIFAAFDPSVGAAFEGSGVGTHLGKFVQVGDLVFDGPPAAIVPGHGSVTLIAANGDELNFDYEGELDSTTGIGTGTLEFTGGTGRFADAAGEGEFYAEIDLSNGPVNAPMSVWLSGDLSY